MTPSKHLKIATRKSRLALKQTDIIQEKLLAAHPDLSIEIVPLTTTGDQNLETTLDKVGGKGVFVKELEQALFDGRADIAVHSMKDVPTELPAGLVLPVMCLREDVRDAFVSKKFAALSELPAGSVVGTSSLRRAVQLQQLHQDLVLKPIRGNVQTRLDKMQAGEFDAIVLAVAGMQRLGIAGEIRSTFSLDELLPAPGQAALGIECRADDETTLSLLKPLQDEAVFACVSAERAASLALGGNCHTPIAIYGQILAGQLQLQGRVGDATGKTLINAQCQGSPENHQAIGQELADALFAQGAAELLAD